MPIFKYINTETGEIVEQYRNSVFDSEPFEKDGQVYKLFKILEDSYDEGGSSNDTLHHPLFIRAVRVIFLDDREARESFLKDLYAILDESDKKAFLENCLKGGFKLSFVNDKISNLIDGDDSQREIDLNKSKESRREKFGSNEVDVQPSDKADKNKKIAFKPAKGVLDLDAVELTAEDVVEVAQQSVDNKDSET